MEHGNERVGKRKTCTMYFKKNIMYATTYAIHFITADSLCECMCMCMCFKL